MDMDVDSVEAGRGELEENVKPKRARRNRRTLTKESMPLTRKDLQYEFLLAILSDTQAVFTDPFKTIHDGRKVTFRDLYVSALLHAKGTKAVQSRMIDSPVFSDDYAMLSLLANVGRISSSMSFFPEARTSNRTYHPIPALQRTDGGLTDGQRVRNTLKSLALPSEGREAPSTPSAILVQKEAGLVPTTNVFNLLFVLNNHSAAIAQAHFQPADCEFEFSDLFRPIPVPSTIRARTFLWLCYHYLEPSPPGHRNPFDTPESDGIARDPLRAPPLSKLSPEELAALPPENVDTPEEEAWAERMASHRRVFLEKEKDAVSGPAGAVSGTPMLNSMQQPSPSPASASVLTIIPPGVSASASTPSFVEKAVIDDDAEAHPQKRKRRPNKPSQESEPHGKLILTVPAQSNRRRASQPEEIEMMNVPPPTEQTISFEPATAAVPASTSLRGTGRSRRGGKRGGVSAAPTETHKLPAQPRLRLNPHQSHRPVETYRALSPEQTMLQYTWYKITAQDPLIDSDEEAPGDHHTYLEYSRRLQTLNRLRGKSPTPSPPPERQHGYVYPEEVSVPIQRRGIRKNGDVTPGVQRVAINSAPTDVDAEWR